MNGLKRIAPAVVVVTLFTLVFQVGFWLLMLPQFQSVGHDVTALELYESLGESSAATGSSKNGSEPATALERQTKQVDALLPLDEKIYDLSVQVEALAKQANVELTGLQISPAAAVTATAAPKATATPASPAAGASPAPTVSPGAALLKDTNLLRSRLTLGISGNYDTIQGFIGGLTRLERFITIDQVTITLGEGGAYAVQISAQAYSYRYVQPKS